MGYCDENNPEGMMFSSPERRGRDVIPYEAPQGSASFLAHSPERAERNVIPYEAPQGSASSLADSLERAERDVIPYETPQGYRSVARSVSSGKWTVRTSKPRRGDVEGPCRLPLRKRESAVPQRGTGLLLPRCFGSPGLFLGRGLVLPATQTSLCTEAEF